MTFQMSQRTTLRHRVGDIPGAGWELAAGKDPESLFGAALTVSRPLGRGRISPLKDGKWWRRWWMRDRKSRTFQASQRAGNEIRMKSCDDGISTLTL